MDDPGFNVMDLHFWRDDPPPRMVPIMAIYSLDDEFGWKDGHCCKRGCCFWWLGNSMMLPTWWRHPTPDELEKHSFKPSRE